MTITKGIANVTSNRQGSGGCGLRILTQWLADKLRVAARRSTLIGARSAATLVRQHFADVNLHDLVTSSRTFPEYMRVDLSRTLERLLPRMEIRCVGLHQRYGQQTLEVATLLRPDGDVSLAPLRFDDVDVGEAAPARCLATALWLIPLTATRVAHVVLLTPAKHYGRMGGWHVEIAVSAGPAGEEVVAGIFETLEAALTRCASYRGKALSLEREQHMMGTGASVLVHRLAPVAREEVILPAATLALLDRNVLQFAARREALRAMGLPVQKGLLFYGPPGTGKTHTIRYLSGALAGHTTLLMSAEQVTNLAHYSSLYSRRTGRRRSRRPSLRARAASIRRSSSRCRTPMAAASWRACTPRGRGSLRLRSTILSSTLRW